MLGITVTFDGESAINTKEYDEVENLESFSVLSQTPSSIFVGSGANKQEDSPTGFALTHLNVWDSADDGTPLTASGE